MHVAVLLLSVLNLVLIVSTLLLMSKLFFKTPGANLSSHIKDCLNRHNYPRLFAKLVAGTSTIFYIGKTKRRLQDRKTEHFNSRPFRNMITLDLLQLLITLKQLVTTSIGTILTFWRPARLTTTVRLRRLCVFKSYSQHWMPMSAVKSFYFVKNAFPMCSFRHSFRLKSLKFLVQMFSI